MVTESIAPAELIDSAKSSKSSSPKPLKGAMKVIKKLKGRIGLGELTLFETVRFPATRTADRHFRPFDCVHSGKKNKQKNQVLRENLGAAWLPVERVATGDTHYLVQRSRGT